MKRSDMIHFILNRITDHFDGIKVEKHIELAEDILHDMERFGMQPPEYTEHNKSTGAGGAWAAGRRKGWEPEE